MKLTLSRKGTFRVGECGDDTTQCGMRGTRKLHYFVSITSDEAQLDRRGFIVDNNEIQLYFDDEYRKVSRFLSCEEIACQSAKDLARLVGVERCAAVKVSIAPGTHAGLTAEWAPAPTPFYAGVKSQ